MIDFNEAEEQRTGAQGAIPEDSIIPFKITFRPPKAGKQGTKHSMYSKSDKGNEYLDAEFEAQGTYAGRKIWQNFTVEGSDTARKISMATFRAIVESARGISPKDASPAATEARKVSDWLDFHEMVFLVKVGVKVEQNNRDAQWYINNTIKTIITPDDEAYQAGEFISDKPLPTVPAAGEAPAARSAGPGGPAPTAPPAGTTATRPAGPAAGAAAKPAAPVPPWAQR